MRELSKPESVELASYKFNGTIPLTISPNATQTTERILSKLKDNVVQKMVDPTEMDFLGQNDPALKALKASLERRNIFIGGLLGVGGIGMAFELKNKHGEVIKSAVLRIDPANAAHFLDSAGAIKPVFQEINDTFAASVVPVARELNEEEKTQLKETLVLLNAEKNAHDEKNAGAITNLHYAKDLNGLDQFMKIDGISLPVLIDLSSMRTKPAPPEFMKIELKNCGFDYDEIIKTPMSQDRVSALRKEQMAVHTAIKSELEIKHEMDLTSVPTKQETPTVEPAAPAADRGVAEEESSSRGHR